MDEARKRLKFWPSIQKDKYLSFKNMTTTKNSTDNNLQLHASNLVQKIK
ncbi:unnamed protein product [Phyllotreta striolata]|uniref:Uncharacterized protein n=1 Tax=Phyllotreta striolata TaxID=444603 RepID=A0A9N9XQT7_PHYSR|nr:unnamed protein product [Phyllotreta striolata]